MAELTCPACGARLELRPAADSDRQRWADAETEALLREAENGPPAPPAPPLPDEGTRYR